MLEESKAPMDVSAKLAQVVDAAVAAATSDSEFVVTPRDYTTTARGELLASLERFEEKPRKKRAGVRFDDVPSFCSYVARHGPGNPERAVFCSIESARFVCIFDYHGVEAEKRAWGDHRADLCLIHTQEWFTWTGKNGSRMKQVEFAEFLEQNSIDVIRPEGAKLIESCMDVTAARDVTFKSAGRLQSGEINFAYSEETSAQPRQGNIALPERFTITLSIFYGSPQIEIEALLRYRISRDGGLTLWYDLLHPFRRVHDAVVSASEDISERLKMDVLHGAVRSMGL